MSKFIRLIAIFIILKLFLIQCYYANMIMENLTVNMTMKNFTENKNYEYEAGLDVGQNSLKEAVSTTKSSFAIFNLTDNSTITKTTFTAPSDHPNLGLLILFVTLCSIILFCILGIDTQNPHIQQELLE